MVYPLYNRHATSDTCRLDSKSLLARIYVLYYVILRLCDSAYDCFRIISQVSNVFSQSYSFHRFQCICMCPGKFAVAGAILLHRMVEVFISLEKAIILTTSTNFDLKFKLVFPLEICFKGNTRNYLAKFWKTLLLTSTENCICDHQVGLSSDCYNSVHWSFKLPTLYNIIVLLNDKRTFLFSTFRSVSRSKFQVPMVRL